MATYEELLPWVLELVKDELGLEPTKEIDDSTTLESLGADSLDAVSLTMEFEDRLHIEIPDDDAEVARPNNTIKDIVSYLVKKTGDSQIPS